MNEYKNVTTPYFESPQDHDVLFVIGSDVVRDAESRIEAAKERAFHGYLANALESPEAFADVTVSSLVSAARDWAESEWHGYLG